MSAPFPNRDMAVIDARITNLIHQIALEIGLLRAQMKNLCRDDTGLEIAAVQRRFAAADAAAREETD